MVAKALDSQITLFTVIESESSKTQTYDELQLIGKDISNSSDILIRQGNPENEIISETESMSIPICSAISMISSIFIPDNGRITGIFTESLAALILEIV